MRYNELNTVQQGIIDKQIVAMLNPVVIPVRVRTPEEIEERIYLATLTSDEIIAYKLNKKRTELVNKLEVIDQSLLLANVEPLEK